MLEEIRSLPLEGHRRILIVEDNPADARLLEVLLEDAGIERLRVMRATSLDEARVRLADEPIDAILLDLGLPDADGLESLHGIADAAQSAVPPVIVVSGNEDPTLREQARRLGVIDFLVKDDLAPFSLGRSLQVALHNRNTSREAGPALARQTSNADVDGLVDDACRRLEETLDESIVISRRLHAEEAMVAETSTAIVAIDALLHGLAELSLRGGSDIVRLKVRTSALADHIIVAVDTVLRSSPEAARREAVSSMMGGSVRAGELRRPLAGAVRAVRRSGGALRCGSGSDGRLWIEIHLPRWCH